ncbi:putative receptor-like protein kinase At3g47110 [Quercus lobata]|uniref:putative receptor-like protein kinase At3g47110 n=1 Tax=Quercus lobata TaxID=97700 RepID=UPI0012447A9C|nr:putative receptor-like protein kinase At3g47110 [Quercus lobata]
MDSSASISHSHQLPSPPNQMTLQQTNLCASSSSIYLHVILLFSTCLLCLQTTITAIALTNETDRLALFKFKESVPQDPFNMLSSWNDSMNFCNWHGITCDRQHQRVTALNLEGYKLHGSISPNIGNLTFLRLINLQNNSFYGEIPQEVGHLYRLQQLNLNNNTLEGEIPSSLSNCSNLRAFGIGINKLSGTIPSSLYNVSSLQILSVAVNQLNGTLPLNIGLNLPNHHKLYLGSNEISGTLPASLGNLVNLIVLTLSENKLSGEIPKKSKKKSPSMVSTIGLLLNVSYKELYQATCGFSLSNLIGYGSIGVVYKGALDQEERLVAIKVLNLQHKRASKSFMVECNALQNIRHRNLVKILTCCSSMDYSGNQFKALVFEFMTNGSLDIWLHPERDNKNQSSNLSLLQRLNIAIDVASVIDYLHNHSTQPVIYCDLKPNIILLDNDMVAHVSDFGLARLLPTTNDSSQKQSSTIGIKGSIAYAAPEYGMGGEASTEGDVYSYRIFLLEMFLGKRPIDEMFKDGLNLHNFAKMALPEGLVQIVDPILLPREVEEMQTSTLAREDNNKNEIQEDKETLDIVNLCHIDANLHKCLVSVLEIGLACSMESPKERMNMEEVTREMHLIKNAFLGSKICRGGLI